MKNLYKSGLVVVVIIGLILILIANIIEEKPSYNKIYIKDMQITSNGTAILSCEEMKGEKKVESVWVIPTREQRGRLYVGNVRYRLTPTGVIFENND